MILQLNGAKKAEVVKRLIDSEISTDFPVSVMKSHANAFLLLDKEASKYI